MIEKFLDAALNLDNSYVKQWKKSGRPVLGYTCSYMPDEILHALDILPVRLRGTDSESTNIGDTYFGPFICSMPKCFLQLAGEGRYSFLDAAVITPGCDSMRRLDECWRKAGDDIEGIVPDFFYYLGVPHKAADYSITWFEHEIERFVEALEKHFSVILSEEKLKTSIDLYNTKRDLLAELDQLRCETELSGADALAIHLAATAMPVQDFNDLCRSFLEHAAKNEKAAAHAKKRILLAGSANDDVELVKLIEGKTAVVVADNICFGARHKTEHVSAGSRPVHALAEYYLLQSECPRMFGTYKKRYEILRDKIERASVDGVILQNIRFCDLHGSENGLFERDLEKEGIPAMKLEREYGPLVETGRIRMRVEAFLERMNTL